MGMYDEIKNKLYCPFCGCKQDGFQTKSFNCCLETLDIYNLEHDGEIHTSCNKCKRWMSIKVSAHYE